MHFIEKEYNLFSEKGSIVDTNIVCVSDIHISPLTELKKLKQILCHIQNLSPKTICLLGDLTNTLTGIKEYKNKEAFRTFMQELNNLTDVFVILGNQDLVQSYGTRIRPVAKNQILEAFDNFNYGNNIHFLDNDYYQLDNINFINYSKSFKLYDDEQNKKELIDELKKLSNKLKMSSKNNNYNILLSHSPSLLLEDDVIREVPLYKNLDLILSGHSHNGLVPHKLEKLFPKDLGIIASGGKIFPRYAKGILEKEGISLIISGGITKIVDTQGELFKKIDKKFPNLFPGEITKVNIRKLKR